MEDIKPRVLFVNHHDQACGVQQMGQKYYKALEKTDKYECFYIDPDSEHGFDHWRDQLNPAIVLYNYYFSGTTMPWLTSGKINAQRHRFKQTTIYHEGDYSKMGFDLIFHQDPSFRERDNYVSLPRPIPEYRISANEIGNPVSSERDPIIKSFGFGFGGKGFTRLAQTVSREFSSARLQINIPYAKFGDESGAGARSWAQQIRDNCGPHINLTVTHDFFSQGRLLDWLSDADLLAFLYDQNGGRGISGTTDYALAVRRPFAITKSDQFKHIYAVTDDCCIEKHTLKEILALGTNHLEQFHTIWGNDACMRSFEKGFAHVLQ